MNIYLQWTSEYAYLQNRGYDSESEWCESNLNQEFNRERMKNI